MPTPSADGLPAAAPAPATALASSRRWGALAFIALAQLMVALDATIVSIALPSIQRALGFSDAERQWLITAYMLPFAGLLLLGGRISDALGRRRAFLVGLAGFATASALGGAASSLGVLIAARALQGTFAALLTPSALSLVATTFVEPRERAKAFAVYGAIAGSGGAVGLVLGGVLTSSVSWHACLYVNVAIAVVALVGARATIAKAPSLGGPKLDVLGAILVTAGSVAIVSGCGRAVALGWTSLAVLGLLAAGALCLALFVLHQQRADAPLLPLRLVLDRNRGGACVAAGLAVVGMFGLFLLLTYYFQVVLGYSPTRAGLAFLPMTAASLFGSSFLAARLLPRVPPRALMAPSLLVAAIGMALLARITVDSGYVADVLPAEILVGFGMGGAMIPAFSVATHGVDPREAGVASAMINSSQNLGGAIGTALLNTVAASTTAHALASAPSARLVALVEGYASAAWVAAGVFSVAAVMAAVLMVAPAPARR